MPHTFCLMHSNLWYLCASLAANTMCSLKNTYISQKFIFGPRLKYIFRSDFFFLSFVYYHSLWVGSNVKRWMLISFFQGYPKLIFSFSSKLLKIKHEGKRIEHFPNDFEFFKQIRPANKMKIECCWSTVIHIIFFFIVNGIIFITICMKWF